MGRRATRLLRDTATMLAVTVALTVTGGTAAAFAMSRHSGASHHPPASARTPATPAPAPATSTPAATPYHVVGLGDSVPSGSQCDCTSYVSLVGQELGDRYGRTVTVDNLARDGLTTSGLLAQLQQTTVRSSIAEAQLVLITVGANDFDEDTVFAPACRRPTALACGQPALAAQRSHLNVILAAVNALRTRQDTQVIVTGYWNVFLDGQVARSRGAAYVAASDALTVADNSLIAAVAAAHSDTYVDIYAPFKGDGTTDDTALLAPDGDHPNAAGHELIARTILRVLA